jgi:hypothetical protein
MAARWGSRRRGTPYHETGVDAFLRVAILLYAVFNGVS